MLINARNFNFFNPPQNKGSQLFTMPCLELQHGAAKAHALGSCCPPAFSCEGAGVRCASLGTPFGVQREHSLAAKHFLFGLVNKTREQNQHHQHLQPSNSPEPLLPDLMLRGTWYICFGVCIGSHPCPCLAQHRSCPCNSN